MKPIPNINDILSDFPEFEGIHPIANAFPMQQPEDFWELVENIKTTGLIHPIRRELGTNLLIDGRNRLLACSITGTLFEVEDVETKRIYGMVTGDNFHSKQYSASQKGMVAQKLKPFYEADAKERQIASGKEYGKGSKVKVKIPEPKQGQSRDAAGKAVGVSGRYVSEEVQGRLCAEIHVPKRKQLDKQ